MSWVGWLFTAINVTATGVSVWQARRARRYRLRADARTLGAISDRARLQQAVDRAWDAAHEFSDEPQLALEAACAHLEHYVTPHVSVSEGWWPDG